MKKKIGIIIDGSTSFTEKEFKKYDLKRIYFRVINTATNQEFKDDDSLTYDYIKQSLEAGNVFKTSCTPIGEIMDEFESALEEYENIIVFPMHKGISSQANNIIAEASEYNGKVLVVDPNMMNREIEYFIIKARELEKQGKSAEEIVEYINEKSKKTATIFTTQSWDGVKGSGRFSTLFKILDKLKIFPIICLEQEAGKFYGFAKDYLNSIEKMVEKFMKENKIKDINKIELMALHGSLLEEKNAKFFINWLSKKFNINKEDILYELCPKAVTVYTGINAYGISLRIKDDDEPISTTSEEKKTKE